MTRPAQRKAVPAIDRARERARSMLDRIVPFPSWSQAVDAQTLAAFGAASPRELYDRLVSALRREVEAPTPTTMHFDCTGALVRCEYGQRHVRREGI